MSIEKLDIQGYRSLADVSWEPAALNTLIGPNRSGKSNVLRALTLYTHLASGNLSKALRKEGGIRAVLWNGTAEEMKLAATFNLVRTSKVVAHSVTLEPLAMPGSYIITLETLAEQVHAIDRKVVLERDANGLSLHDRRPYHADTTLLNQEESAIPRVAEPLHSPVLTAAQMEMVQWSVHHDIDVSSDSEIRRAAVSRLEKQLEPSGENLIPVLHTCYTNDRGFEALLDESMTAAFGPDYEKLLFPPAEDNRVQMRIRWKSLKRPESAADMSDGTLRFLFLIAALCSPDPPTLVAIDEPEVGLHPHMLPIVAELAQEAATRTQVILATHSPDLLDAFTGKDAATTVVLNQEGQTVLKKLGGERLSKWLEKYRLGDLWKSGELEDME